MNPTKRIATFAALLLLASNAHSEPPQFAPKVGDEYEISSRYETSEKSSEGASGSSRGRDTYLERVIGVRDGGVELEFDLPKNATADDRARSWQFPVRVFRPNDGAMQLLNAREMETRVDDWLKAAGMTLDNLVMHRTYLADRCYTTLNRAVRNEVLGSRETALTVVIAGIFDEAWLLEIEAVAAG